MLTFTLDTNCIIDIEQARVGSDELTKLVEKHTQGSIDVALVGVSASERQPGDFYLKSFDDFKNRLQSAGLGRLSILLPILYWGISFWDYGLYADDSMIERERQIHETLFPNLPFLWADFAKERGVSPDAIKDSAAKLWRNAFCDRQMYWAHDHNKRDIFVTSDKNFVRIRSSPRGFPAAIIATPSEAATMMDEYCGREL